MRQQVSPIRARPIRACSNRASSNRVKVRASLCNGFASNDPCIPLDSILLRQHLLGKFGIDYIQNFNPETDDFQYPDDFPIEKRYSDTEFWYYACSFGQYDLIGEDIQYWHKRVRDEHTELIDFQGKRGRIRTSSGVYKGYRMPIQLWLTKEIEWYLIGEIETISDLLCGVSHIGKKWSQGFGRVSRWAVEEIPHDWSERKENHWTRAVPGAILLQFSLQPGQYKYRAYRPPYWWHGNFALCTEPGAIIQEPL